MGSALLGPVSGYLPRARGATVLNLHEANSNCISSMLNIVHSRSHRLLQVPRLNYVKIIPTIFLSLVIELVPTALMYYFGY